MNTQTPDTTAILLARYYEADAREAERLEEALLAGIKPLLYKQLHAENLSPDDIQDFFQETCIRITKGLRDCRLHQTRIHYFTAWTRRVVNNVVRGAKRAHTPRRAMSLAVDYLVTDSKQSVHYARWQTSPACMIGLRAHRSLPFSATPRYTAFCHDTVPFMQQALDGRNPADSGQVELAELLLRFLQWIDTPLEQPLLVDHLLELQPISVLQEVPAEEATDALCGAREDDLSEVFGEDIRRDWEKCRHIICNLSPLARTTFILKQDRNMLCCLSGQINACVLLARLLDVSLEDAQKVWPALPFSDEAIAERYQTNKGNVHRMRSYAIQRIRQQIETLPFL